MSCHHADDLARYFALVAPTSREREILAEAVAFAPRVPGGFAIPPHLYHVFWYAGDRLVPLDSGWVDLAGRRRPVRMFLLAGRLAAARTEEQRQLAETALLSTCFHELSHVRDVLTWSQPIDVDASEARAEAFADRALQAVAAHQARWRQFGGHDDAGEPMMMHEMTMTTDRSQSWMRARPTPAARFRPVT